MELPDDAQPLFERLGNFLLSDRLEAFREDAARRCELVVPERDIELAIRRKALFEKDPDAHAFTGGIT